MADLRGAAGLPHLCLHGGGGLFPHPQLSKIRPADAGVRGALRDTLRPDVRRHMVLPGTPERDLDAAAGASGHPADRGGTAEGKALGVPAGVRPRGPRRYGAGYAGHGGLLRRRCFDGADLLHLPWAEMVVSAGAAAGSLLGECGAAGRPDVPREAAGHGI